MGAHNIMLWRLIVFLINSSIVKLCVRRELQVMSESIRRQTVSWLLVTSQGRPRGRPRKLSKGVSCHIIALFRQGNTNRLVTMIYYRVGLYLNSNRPITPSLFVKWKYFEYFQITLRFTMSPRILVLCHSQLCWRTVSFQMPRFSSSFMFPAGV